MMRLASTVVTLVALAQGRETRTADGRKAREGEVVGLDQNDDFCLFENADDKWCFSTTPPMMKAGWNVAQTFSKTAATEPPVIEYYSWMF